LDVRSPGSTGSMALIMGFEADATTTRRSARRSSAPS
jgi:hypothetical protein